MATRNQRRHPAKMMAPPGGMVVTRAPVDINKVPRSCRTREGHEKRKFPSRAAAKAAIKSYRRKDLVPYQCPVDPLFFHIGARIPAPRDRHAE